MSKKRGASAPPMMASNDGDDDENDINVDNRSAKRVRPAAQPFGVDGGDDDDDDMMNDDDDDESDADESSESEEEEDASQQSHADGTSPWGSGHIRKLVLLDFLVHRNFSIRFGRHANWVNGVNTSGKSAILAAIQLVLGCKATETGKHPNLAGFITYGCSFAKISLTLSNEGLLAYRHDVYGDSIIIVRKITKTGSTYSICDADGVQKTRDKRELEQILQHFSIVPSNPCILMPQQYFKDFFAEPNPNNYYRFFMKASGLDALWDNIAKISEFVQKTKSVGAALEEQKQELDRKCAVAEGEARKAECIPQYAKEVQDRYDEYLLSQSNLFKQYVEHAEQQVEMQRVKISKLEEKLGKYEKKDPSQLQASIDAEKIELAKQRAAMMKEIDALKRRSQSLQKELPQSNEIKKQKQKIDLLTKQKKRAEAEVARCHQEMKRDAKGEQRVIMEKLEAKKNDFANIEDKERESINKAKLLKREATKASDELDRLRDADKQHQLGLQRARRRLQDIADTKKDAMNRFGNHTPLILSEIQKHKNKFKQLPLGPLGRYVHLAPGVQGYQIGCIQECVKSELLNSYATSCQADTSVLFSIIQAVAKRLKLTHKQKPSIFTSDFSRRRYDNTNTEGIKFRGQSLSTVMSRLVFDNDTVFNIVLDQSRCDVWYIVPEQNFAIDVCKQFGDSRPKVFRGCITQKSSIRGHHGNTSVTPIRENQRTLLRSVDGNGDGGGADDEDQLKDEIANSQRALQEIKPQLNDANRADVKAKNASSAAARESTALANKLSKLQQDISVLEGKIVADDDAPDLSATIKEANDRIDDALSQIEARQAAIAELSKKRSAAKEKVDAVMQERDEKHSRVQEIDAALNDTDEKMEAIIREASRHEQKIEANKAKIVEAKAKLLPMLEELEGHKEQLAKSLDHEDMKSILKRNKQPRNVPDKKTAHRNWEKAKQKLQMAEQSSSESWEVLFGRAIALKTQKQEANDALRRQSKQLKIVDEQLAARRKEYKLHLKAHQNNTYSQFTEYLKTLNFSGDLNFNHETNEMEIRVKTTKDICEETGESKTTDLSGGERAFSAVAFIMAMGSGAECPFRSIDEFGVNLDTATRTSVIHMLRDVAENSANRRQFIFLTPLTVSTVSQFPNQQFHKVIRLPPPLVGNQAQIGFARRGNGGASDEE